jgi:YesN/AraC family two-component response regulator
MEFVSHPMPPISLLLVEDEELTLKPLITILTKKFPEVSLYTANNGRTGLELFKAHMPDIVITDINMPEMDGLQMTGKIRAIKPGTKFIVITSGTRELTLETSVEKEFEIDHYIVKPVGLEALFAVIEQCLDGVAHKKLKAMENQ